MRKLEHRARGTRAVIGWLIVLTVLVTAGFAVYRVIQHEMRPRQIVTIGKATYTADIAQTDEQRERGLSGRKELKTNQALLFRFPKDSQWGIWMKSMLFPIDVIWLDEKRTVVHVARDVQPDAEPYTVYRPSVPARYVLEVPAGDAVKHGIRNGIVARFEMEQGGW